MKLLNRTLVVFAWSGMFLSGAAFAVSAPLGNQLKKVQVSDGSRVDLVFDNKVAPTQVQLDFFNDVVQLTLTDISVYPAKVSSYSGTVLQKIFAYQYAPKVVRCRFTVRGKAESFKDKIKIQHSGKMMTVWLGGQSDQIQASAARSEEELKDQSLLQKVMNSEPKKNIAPVAEVAAPQSHIDTKTSNNNALNNVPIGSKVIKAPSPWRALGTLAVVLALFLAFVIVLKKVKNKSAAAGTAGWLGPLAKFAKSGISKKGKMIEVIATHYLGPKQSVVVMKVSGRILVLGVSNDSINLITQLQDESKVADLEDQLDDLDGLISSNAPSQNTGIGAMSAGPAVFSNILSKESSMPSVRSRIKNRLEGMKTL